jgi:hypothetical protein
MLYLSRVPTLTFVAVNSGYNTDGDSYIKTKRLLLNVLTLILILILILTLTLTLTLTL